jgi:hypothetical protein
LGNLTGFTLLNAASAGPLQGFNRVKISICWFLGAWISFFGGEKPMLLCRLNPPETGGVQWLFAEPLTVKCRFFMSRLRGLGMDNGSWLQVEPLNCEPLAQTWLIDLID